MSSLKDAHENQRPQRLSRTFTATKAGPVNREVAVEVASGSAIPALIKAASVLLAID